MSQVLNKILLYSSWRSSCSYRVRMCLNIKEIKHDIKPVNLIKLAKSTEDTNDYQVNPMRYVPALQIDGHTLIESMAIMEYIEETRPLPSLMPHDPFARAQVRAICDVIVSGVQPLQNIGVLNHMGNYLGEEERKWSQFWIAKGFAALEKLLSKSAGKYCVGDEISLADCCLVPQVFNARRWRFLFKSISLLNQLIPFRFHAKLDHYPTILRIDRLLHGHKAVKKAHPFMQEDFPFETFTDMSFYGTKL